MKNAYVLEHHYGDDGSVTEGMILVDVSTKRFDALEKAGLVREASDDEVKAGYVPPFEKDDNHDADLTPAEEGKSAEKKAAEPANKKAAEPANKGA